MPDTRLTVEELIRILIEYWGKGSYQIGNGTKNFHEAGSLELDTSKSRKLLQWSPKYSVKETIEKSIVWYKNFLSSPDKAPQLTEDEILKYVQ